MSDGDNEAFETMEVLIVPHEWAGKRVDLFISANAPDDLSRARVQALVRQGLVVINGAAPRGTSSKIAAGDVVRFTMPEAQEAEPEPQDIPLAILHEDADLIVIDKPSGMVVHPAPGNWSGTLVNALLHHCAGQLSGIGGVKRPGIVHRLDKGTSGVMVIAKSYRAHVDLQEQFADHGRSGPLRRSYLALVWGMPPRMKGLVDAPLGRHPTKRLQRAVVPPDAPDAKEAITHYDVLDRFGVSQKTGEPLVSLVECTLETGRTHQIRVHMGHLGCFLLGDPEYGRQFANRSMRLPDDAQTALGEMNRQALHARTLGIRHPATGETMHFEAPTPPDMQRLIDAFN
ncbi:MAG: RluA family pseudouridine synthase [Ahrensia sp.]|nr:RluA family pseudouridine synthase [Ahrensia sp.]